MQELEMSKAELAFELRDTRLLLEIEKKICEELREKVNQQSEKIRELSCDLAVEKDKVRRKEEHIEWLKQDRDWTWNLYRRYHDRVEETCDGEAE